MSLTSRTVRAGDLYFNVEIGGPDDGRPILLLHGFPQTARCWQHVAPLLHAAGLRTFAPDQRGYSPGARPRSKSEYTIDKLTGDVTAIADVLGLDRFDLAAHDWGGFVGWQVAASTPQRVRSFTVLSTPHPAAFAEAYLSDPAQHKQSVYMRLFRIPALPEWFLLRKNAAALRSAFGDGVPREDADAYADALAAPGALRGALNWYRAKDIAALRHTPEIVVPTTYMWGSADIALGRTAAEATGARVNGDYRFIELDESHWIPDLRPNEVAAAILNRVTTAP